MSEQMAIGERDILLIVDMQSDFCPGGGLAVPRGDEIVPPVNRLAARFRHVVMTQDWHPRGHLSFASSYPGRTPYETIALAYGTQVLWPIIACRERGRDIRADLAVPHAQLVLRKGYHREIDSYSAFVENDRKTSTGLAGYSRTRLCARRRGRARLRLLRTLFGRGCPSRGLPGDRRRRCLPRHRRRGLHGADASAPGGAGHSLRQRRERGLKFNSVGRSSPGRASMRHQGRSRHRFQDAARDAAKDELAQA